MESVLRRTTLLSMGLALGLIVAGTTVPLHVAGAALMLLSAVLILRYGLPS